MSKRMFFAIAQRIDPTDTLKYVGGVLTWRNVASVTLGTMLIVLLSWLTVVLFFLCDGEGATVLPDPNPSKAEFAAAHCFHGVLSSYKDNDEWVFWREGKRCKLFPKGE